MIKMQRQAISQSVIIWTYTGKCSGGVCCASVINVSIQCTVYSGVVAYCRSAQFRLLKNRSTRQHYFHCKDVDVCSMKNKQSEIYRVNDANGVAPGNDVSRHDAEVCDVKDDMLDEEVRCGYSGCKPDGLQRFNNTKILVLVMCIFAFSQGKSFVVSGSTNRTRNCRSRFEPMSCKKMAVVWHL